MDAHIILLLVCAQFAAGDSAPFDYDLFVIGGGSGGLACAREAAALGASVALCDFVNPSPQGTRWGIGGTCVNVGCIPKKLMHQAAQLRYLIDDDAAAFGYQLGGAADATDETPRARARTPHDWKTLVRNIQLHVRSLNFGYRSELQHAGVKYLNQLGRFDGGHDVRLVDAKGTESTVRAKHIVVAVGGRPHFPEDFVGAREHCISSDDLFSLDSRPGKVLVVGGGYVALECAGFLHALGCEVVLLLRSIPLRGFDRECADKVLAHLANEGVRVVHSATPSAVSRTPSGQRLVRWQRREAAKPRKRCDPSH